VLYEVGVSIERNLDRLSSISSDGAMGEFEVLKAMRDLHSDDRNADTEFRSEIETGRAVPAAPAEKGGLGIFEALW
jgi:hypothetical protein